MYVGSTSQDAVDSLQHVGDVTVVPVGQGIAGLSAWSRMARRMNQTCTSSYSVLIQGTHCQSEIVLVAWWISI